MSVSLLYCEGGKKKIDSRVLNLFLSDLCTV